MPGFKLEGDLQAKLGQIGPAHKRDMVSAAKHVAPQALEYMKTNAPWTDRTTNARDGLQSEVVISTNRVAIVLYHTMPYGVFLETRWGGKFGIIRDTVQIFAPKYVETVGKLMFK